jgi:hypothetical protein
MGRWFAIAQPTQATLLQITLAMRSLRVANDGCGAEIGSPEHAAFGLWRVMIRDRRDLVLGWLLAKGGCVGCYRHHGRVAAPVLEPLPAPHHGGRCGGWYGRLWLGVLASVGRRGWRVCLVPAPRGRPQLRHYFALSYLSDHQHHLGTSLFRRRADARSQAEAASRLKDEFLHTVSQNCASR